MILGVIADDFTGASDAGSYLVKGGMRTILINGMDEIPETLPQGIDAVIIALKSRSIPAKEAVQQSLAALDILKTFGCEHFYFKYASTFDSTPKGNIGPVADALMKRLRVPFSLLIPALPENGRQVKDGKLFVLGVPLNESPMKDHPLNPMWDSNLTHLMAAQSQYPSFAISAESTRDLMEASEKEYKKIIKKWKQSAGDVHFYLVPDYADEIEGASVAAAFHRCRFLTGGSGILYHLARVWKESEASNASPVLLLSGSCSNATLGQVAKYQETKSSPFIKIDPITLSKPDFDYEALWRQIESERGDASYVLVSSSEVPEVVKKQQEVLGVEGASAVLEKTCAWLAQRAIQAGYRDIIVAGGETSGAVTTALHYDAFEIGPSVAPGVPMMRPVSDPSVQVVLKSGNFGSEDFFEEAITMVRKERSKME